MEKEYYVKCKLGYLSQWIKVDMFHFNMFYYDDSYFIKRYSCVRHGFKRDYYTFYKQCSNGLCKLNSIVRFMVFYG